MCLRGEEKGGRFATFAHFINRPAYIFEHQGIRVEADKLCTGPTHNRTKQARQAPFDRD